MRSLLIFLSLISLMANGQGEDSLFQVINNIKSDTERVNQLYQRGFVIRNNDPKLAYKYALLCKEEALKSDSKKHLAKSYNLLGILTYKKGDFKSAIIYHSDALKLRRECGDNYGIALSQTNLGNIYTDLKFFEKAESYYLSALQVYEELQYTKQTANCLINLGVLKQQTNLNEVALEYFSLALKKGETINDYEIRSICLNNLGTIYFDKKDFEKAVGFDEDALKIRSLMENNLEVSDSYLNLADDYIQLKEFNQAKFCLDTAFYIAKKYDYYDTWSHAYKIYAEYFSAIKNFETAYSWLKRYHEIKDSVLILEKDSGSINDGNFESVVPETQKNKSSAYWLLLPLILFLILVPYYLFGLKR